ncbi:unknown [Sutterella wadsworthensis CAG:135]|nr:unknown [Sutterella wadsworthensis CAG:135]
MKFRMVCTKPINFCTAFLSIIFAKGKRAGTCAFQKSLLVKSFPNGQKLDASLRPSRLLFGFRQHLLYVCKPLFQAWLKFAHCFSFS